MAKGLAIMPSDPPFDDPRLTTAAISASGGCQCGQVRFRVRRVVPLAAECHCGQCRRFHGHVGSYVCPRAEDVVFDQQEGLAWYRSSERAERGFCRQCGSSLFWRQIDGATLEVAVGCLDDTTGFRTIRHIWVGSKGPYYDLSDDLPKFIEEAGGPLWTAT